jgi:hypothetical protein
MELHNRPPDCSICRTLVDSLTLVEGCIWLCQPCLNFWRDEKMRIRERGIPIPCANCKNYVGILLVQDKKPVDRLEVIRFL